MLLRYPGSLLGRGANQRVKTYSCRDARQGRMRRGHVVGAADSRGGCETENSVGKPTKFKGDKRRKHHHYLVTVSYGDADRFGRVYTDLEKARRFAERQKKSPAVKSVQIKELS
jgi:hypothetical protein